MGLVDGGALLQQVTLRSPGRGWGWDLSFLETQTGVRASFLFLTALISLSAGLSLGSRGLMCLVYQGPR